MSQLPPGPSARPSVQLMRWSRHPTELLEECAATYGNTFTLRFPGYPPLVFLTDPAAIKEVFTGTSDEIRQGPFPPFMRPQMGDGSLLFLDGAPHQRERKLLMPAFHHERMVAYGHTIRSITDQVIDRWPIGQPFPIHAAMQEIALDTILRTVFGMEDGERLTALRDVLKVWSEQGRSSRRPSSILTLLALMLIPGPTIDRLYRVSERKPTVAGRAVDISALFPWRDAVRVQRRIDAILATEITRARAETDRDRTDILSMLIASRDADGRPMSDSDLRDEMMTFLIAGQETTATALSWCMHLVLTHPQVAERLRTELKALPPDEIAGGRDILRFEYLDATIKEALRLRPVVPHAARLLGVPRRLSGFDLPAGVMVLPSSYLTQRRADLFPDPTVFRPERFLGAHSSPYEYFPFGGGVRRCIGQAFAMYEMKIVIARVLSRVTMHPAPGEPVQTVLRSVTFRPSNGVPVVVTARRDGSGSDRG
jgi:cytochrome P450 family 110